MVLLIVYERLLSHIKEIFEFVHIFLIFHCDFIHNSVRIHCQKELIN